MENIEIDSISTGPENVDSGVRLKSDYSTIITRYDELMDLYKTDSRIISAHSKKIVELVDDLGTCDKMVTDIVNYINNELYDWVVEMNDTTTEFREFSDKTEYKMDLFDMKLKDTRDDQKEMGRLLNALCVDTHKMMKDISSFIHVICILCGGLAIASIIAFANLETPEYILIFAMLLVCTISLICISFLIRNIANTNRFVYRSLYKILGDETDETEIAEDGR